MYPTWELEEAWRELLQAQHHDNDECEGLCGHVGRRSYERAQGLADDVMEAQTEALAKRFSGAVAFNPLGWPVTFHARDGLVVLPPCGWAPLNAPSLPPATYRAGERPGDWTDGQIVARIKDDGVIRLARGDLRAEFFRLRMTVDGQPQTFRHHKPPSPDRHNGKRRLTCDAGGEVDVRFSFPSDREGALDVWGTLSGLPRPDGGLNAALQAELRLGKPFRIVADGPYGMDSVAPRGSYRKKYPTGDWMTSPQWFETVERPFHALSLVDLVAEDGSGLLVLHDGSQQWFADDDGVRVVLTAYDPWDEDRYEMEGAFHFRLIPHQGLTNAQRWRLAQELTRPPTVVEGKGTQELEAYPLVACDAPSVAITAVYRESESPRLDRPTYVRLVELDGREAHANLTFGATVAAAWRTDLLGEPTDEPCEHDGRRVRTTLRPHEIATVCVDAVEARKQVRDLDARRDVWATVHRQDDPPPERA